MKVPRQKKFVSNPTSLAGGAFNMDIPMSVYNDGKEQPDSLEKIHITCGERGGDIWCALRSVGFECHNQSSASFTFGEYSTSDTNMKLNKLELATGKLAFEFSFGSKSSISANFVCGGNFEASTEEVEIIKGQPPIKVTTNTPVLFSCQGTMTFGTDVWSKTYKLRKLENLANFCKKIPF